MQLNATWSVIVTLIPALLAFSSGLFKLSGSKLVTDTLAQIGVAPLAKWLGLTEIIGAILFVLPPTNTIGFLLLACYFSGALATDLTHHRPIKMPLLILVLLFIAEFLVNNTLFLL